MQVSFKFNPPISDVTSKWRQLKERGYYESLGRMAYQIRDVVAPVLAQEAPARTGEFKQSIIANISGSGGSRTIDFTADSPLALFIIRGTRPHEIYPVNKTVLSFIAADGHHVFSKHVHHPGTDPNNFPLRAFNLVRPDVLDILERTGREILANVS